MYLVSLFAAAALLSLQCNFASSASVDVVKDIDNNLESNNVPPTTHRKLRKFVDIADPPPETAKQAIGSILQLKCGVVASPAPYVQWLKNGEPLSDYEEDTNEIFTAHQSSLARFTSSLIISTPSNNIEDVYTCVASSGLKTAAASTTVFTEQDDNEDEMFSLRKILSTPRKPIITTYLNEILQDMGSTAVLPCQSYSHPKAQVIWKDQNDVVLNFAGNPRIRVLPSGALMLTNLRWSDMGHYTCSAKNVYGMDSITTFLYPLKH